MPKRYAPGEVIKVLEAAGFYHSRTEGDHFIMRRDSDSRTVPIPLNHRELRVGTFGSVLRLAGMKRFDFEALARNVL